MVKFIPFHEDKYLGLRFYRDRNNYSYYTELIIKLDYKQIEVDMWKNSTRTLAMGFTPDYTT